MVFSPCPSLQEQPPLSIKNKDRKSPVQGSGMMNLHLFRHSEGLITLINEYQLFHDDYSTIELTPQIFSVLMILTVGSGIIDLSILFLP